jgi:hypothetical protein
VGIFDGTKDNAVLNRGNNRREMTTQLTALSRIGMIQESGAERRRLLSTTIDHYMYEVILWMTRGSMQSTR